MNALSQPRFDSDDLGEEASPQQQWALPHDEDAERAVLGAAMLSPAALAEIRPLLTGRDYYKPAPETIWNTLAELADAGRPR
jgi:replicative DNA helicase